MIKQNGLVILTVEDFHKLCENQIPTYYLTGKKAKELDRLVKEGLREYEEGKCRSVKSLSELD